MLDSKTTGVYCLQMGRSSLVKSAVMGRTGSYSSGMSTGMGMQFLHKRG